MIVSAPVTVIIPTFNCQQWVGQAIDSAVRQTIPPARVIVVDDGSTDATPSLLAAYGDPIRTLSQENRGVATARNRGMGEVATEWIAFLAWPSGNLPPIATDALPLATVIDRAQLAVKNRLAISSYTAGFRTLLSSIAWYPLRIRLSRVEVSLGGARRLAVLVLRMLRMMSPDPNCG